MERPASRGLSIPTRPESGLAEWAEKIKAIQRQVDDDEAEEQRRLEDEIRASRLARKRRSQGYGSRSGTPAVVDEAPVVEPRSPTRGDDEDFRDYATRQRAQADALTKLSSATSTPQPQSLAAFIGGRAGGPRLNKHAPQADAHDPTQFEQRSVDRISAAPHPVFGRGGVAMPGLASKGRTEPERAVSPQPIKEPSPPAPTTTPAVSRERRVSTSNPALKRYMDHVSHSSPVPKPEPIRTRTFSTPAGAPLKSPPLTASASSRPDYGRPITPRTATPRAVSPVPKPAYVAPKLATPAVSPKPPAPAPKPSFAPTPSLSTPASTKPSTTPSPGTSPKPTPTPSIPTPSLARPVHPTPKPPPFGPRTPPSVHASAAFSRQPLHKDPTPSISRLKGRGFVASVVKASAQLEGGGDGGAGEGGSGGRGGAKRLSDLKERWAPSTDPVPASPPANKPVASYRKSWTPASKPEPTPPPKPVPIHTEEDNGWDAPKVRRTTSRPELRKSVSSTSLKKEPLRDEPSHSVHKSPSSRSLRNKSSSHSLRHKSSSHSLKNKSSSGSLRAPNDEGEGGERPPSPGGRPMGSSSTMISYIKPMKTGDDDARSSLSVSGSGAGAASRSARARSEVGGREYSASTLGRKARSDIGGGGGGGGGGAGSPGKPLSHLTKDRAKRPKKKGHASTAPTSGKTTTEDGATEDAQRLVPATPLATDAQQPSAAPTPSAPTFSSTPASTPAPTPAPALQKRTSVADRWTSQAVLGVRSTPSSTSTPSTAPTAPAKEKDEEKKKPMIGARALPGLALPGMGSAATGLRSPTVPLKSPTVPPKSPALALRSPSLPQPVSKSQSPAVPPKSPALSKPVSPVLAFPKAPSPTPPAKAPSPTPPSVPGKDSVSSEGSNANNTPPSRPAQPQRSPSRRRERIPSTGSRARVMEVAQMLHEREASLQSAQSDSAPTSPILTSPPHIAAVLHSPAGTERREVLVAPPLERRRSSFEAFGSLPVLEEVRTPAGTLARKGGSPLPVLQDEDVPPPASKEEVKMEMERDMVTIEHNDRPIPTLDVAALVNAHSANTKSAFDPKTILTISVEVLSVTGATATALPTPSSSTFHDTETLAIVHRYKLKSNGLVNTRVYAWYGRKSAPGELEHAKLAGLARRYGVALEEVRQGAEGEDGGEMVGVLGGVLACRQGSRTHWSAENTTMHVVRSLPFRSPPSSSTSTSTSTSSAELPLATIDELDLSVANLCSGFSYVLTLLGSSYIWHGRGSLAHERAVARIYAKGLCGDGGSEVVELFEGREEEDGGESAELFWMMLGEREYARAEYWRFRGEEGERGARAWKVDAEELTPLRSFPTEPTNDTIYLLDCTYELFVLVGKHARSKRADIRLALEAAEKLSRYVERERPFRPPVHVVVLPSKVPADLRFHFRGVDEDALNENDVPDHMNLLPAHEAFEHLDRKVWHRHELSDEKMLPLGIHPSHLT